MRKDEHKFSKLTEKGRPFSRERVRSSSKTQPVSSSGGVLSC